MARSKGLNPKKHVSQPKKTEQKSKTGREEKILNAMANTTVILMSTMMGAFTQVMVNATSAVASGMAEAMGGKEAGDEVNKEIKQKLPEVNDKMKAMISDIRKDIYAQMGQKKKELAPLLADPAFDSGPKIIENYDFNLKQLTQELDDKTLTQYSQLLVEEDPRFVKMFQELAKWLNSLPKPLTKSKKKTEK
jgi:F0F1-type ATP synthase membrane subunit b/b'